MALSRCGDFGYAAVVFHHNPHCSRYVMAIGGFSCTMEDEQVLGTALGTNLWFFTVHFRELLVDVFADDIEKFFLHVFAWLVIG